MEKFLLFCLSLITLLVSCGKPGPENIEGPAPVVESVTVDDGAEGVALDIGVIDILYDVPVILSDASKIILSDTEIEVAVTNKRLRITFGGLEYNGEYRLTVGAGAVLSKSSGKGCEEFSLSFRTVTTSVDPNPPYVPGEPGDYSESLVTANPIPNAVRLYDYLLSIYGKKTLSGAMAKVDWNTDEAEWIGKCTGEYPAIATFDYIHLNDSPSSWIDYGNISPAKGWFDRGGIVSACWHWNVPVSEGGKELTFDPSKTTFDASDAVKEGTWENGVVQADLKKLAGYLKLLQDEGIPVIWRPLHEAAGNTYTQWHSGAWFWWGADGARAFRELWVYMFDFLENEGVRNLIWVWTTQTSSEGDADYEFYPGDEYVDIVGRDIYNVTSASDIASQFETIARMTPRKMVALSENGNVAGIADQWNAGAGWLYFMPWYDYENDWTSGFAHQHATISWWNAAFASENVVGLSGLPDDLYEK